MRLRTISTPSRFAGLRPAGRRLLGLLLAALVLFAATAASSRAGVTEYSGTTLYLAGAPSGKTGVASFQLTTAAPPATPPAPTGISAGAFGGGADLHGASSNSFTYLYVSSNAGGSYSAGPASASITASSTNPNVKITAAPAGYDIYRKKGNDGNIYRVAAGWGGGDFVDPVADPPPTGTRVLPTAANRLAGNVTGDAPFTPGSAPARSTDNDTPTPAATGSCTGWMVDGDGAVSFPAQNWTFVARTRNPSGATGVAHLVVGMWRANDAGAIVGTPIIDPTQPAQSENTTNAPVNMVQASGAAAQTMTHTYNPGAFTLAKGEHLCVQYWRRQTTAYSSSAFTPGAINRLATMLGYDGSAGASTFPQITHPAPNAFANVPTLSAPAAGTSVSAVPALQAGYSDAEGDAGTVTFRLCSGSDCSGGAIQTSSGLAAASGGSASWTPAAVADGTYAWQAEAADNSGGTLGWATERSFTLTTTPAVTGASPAGGVVVNAVNLSGTFTDPNPADNGSLEFRVCPDTLCLTITTSQSVAVANGATGTWSPTISDGLYYWQVRAVDGAGNPSAWSASRSFTLDSTPPDTTIGAGGPADPTKVTSATFNFSGSESGSTFECSLDGGGFSSCTSPKTYTGLGEAPSPHTFHVRATDGVGNVDPTPAVYVWKVDTTAPDTSIGAGKPAALSNTASPSFDLVSTESGSTFRCSLDGAAYASCTTPNAYTNLADGSHTFAVQATDAAGNVDGSPASYSWTIDTRAPETTLGSSRPSPHSNSRAASFTFSSTDTGASFECSSDDGAYTACGTPRTIADLVDGSHSFAVRAVDAAGNADATPASYGWSVDTIVPQVPDTPAPGAETWRRSATLSAVFVDPTFGSSGAVDFRVCADALCANVVSSGTSGVVANGATADWTPSSKPADGHYFWQARARDVSGNQSAWSGASPLDLDGTPPTAPPHFNGIVAEDGLTLRWDPVVDTVANYVVFVDGVALVNLGAQTFELKLGAFDAGDSRRFSVVAVDRAGNVGAASPMLVGVPNVIGLTVTAASDALSSRGLHVKQSAALVHTGVATIVAQDPTPATLAEQGSAVQVLVTDGIGGATPLSLTAGPVKARCAAGSRIKLHLRLSDRADVSWTVRTVRGAKGRLGTLSAGSNDVRIKLPKRLRSGRTYVLDLRAISGTRTARASVKVVAARASGVCGAR